MDSFPCLRSIEIHLELVTVDEYVGWRESPKSRFLKFAFGKILIFFFWENIFQTSFIFLAGDNQGFTTHVATVSNSPGARRYDFSKFVTKPKFQGFPLIFYMRLLRKPSKSVQNHQILTNRVRILCTNVQIALSEWVL